MLDGMPYLIAQILAPMVAALVAGLVAGWVAHALLDPTGHRAKDLAATDAKRHSDAGDPPGAPAEDGTEIRALRATIERLRDQHETELGRLETGAIEAMESTITRSEQRIRLLEEELARTKDQLRDREVELSTQRTQAVRLRDLLQERDRRISKLTRQPSPPPT